MKVYHPHHEYDIPIVSYESEKNKEKCENFTNKTNIILTPACRILRMKNKIEKIVRKIEATPTTPYYHMYTLLLLYIVNLFIYLNMLT